MRTLARTPTAGTPSWSTDIHTSAHAPFGRSVTHVLEERIKTFSLIKKENKNTEPEHNIEDTDRQTGWRWEELVPEHQMVSGGMWSHGVPDVLVDLCPLVQSFYHATLEQVLVPVALLSQNPIQNLLGTGGHLHRYLPQSQRKPIMHLEESMERVCLYLHIVFF